MKPTCRICGKRCDVLRTINLFVVGSEGLDACHACEMLLVSFARSLIEIAGRSKMEAYRNLKENYERR